MHLQQLCVVYTVLYSLRISAWLPACLAVVVATMKRSKPLDE